MVSDLTVEERLRQLIFSRFKSLKQFCAESGLNYSTVYAILDRGVANAGLQNVFKMCDALGISADSLANGEIAEKDTVASKTKVKADAIVKILKENLHQRFELTIKGVPLTDDEIQTLLDALEIAVGIVKRNRERNEKGDET